MAKLSWLANLRVQDMKKNNLLQCAVWEPIDEKWYLCQAQGAGARDKEDNLIRKFNWDGKYEGYCRANLWGHGNQIGVRKSASGNVWIWIPMDSYNSAGTTTRTRASRVIWKKDAEYSRKESASVDIFNASWAMQGFSLAGDPGIMYTRDGHQGYEQYCMTEEEDFRNERGKKIRKIDAKKSPGKYFQGCTANKDYLWILRGSTDKTHYIDMYRWKTGNKVKRIEISAKQLKDCLRKRTTNKASSVEAEGLEVVNGYLYVGCRTGPAGSRRNFSIMEIDHS